jgi:hypothetical protein
MYDAAAAGTVGTDFDTICKSGTEIGCNFISYAGNKGHVIRW